MALARFDEPIQVCSVDQDTSQRRPVGIQPDDLGPRSIDVQDVASELSFLDAGIVVDGDVPAGCVTESAEAEHQRSGSGDGQSDFGGSTTPAGKPIPFAQHRSERLTPVEARLEGWDRFRISRERRVRVTRPLVTTTDGWLPSRLADPSSSAMPAQSPWGSA
jgi:hypothetical protein